MGPNGEQLYTAQLKQRKKRYGAQSREQSFCPISMQAGSANDIQEV